MLEYLAPLMAVEIGGFPVQKVAECRVTSARNSPMDRAELVVPVEHLDPMAIRAGAEVVIQAGYREKGSWVLFAGTAIDVAWGPRVRLQCRDRMDRLHRTHVTQALADVTAREVVDYVVGQAGLDSTNLSNAETPRRHYFVLSGQNAIEAIRLVNRTWQLDFGFFIDPEDGSFWWGAWDESPRSRADAVRFEYGRNIVRLEPFTRERYGLLETIFLPYVRHSQPLRIVDRRYWGQDVQARVERVIHVVTDRRARSVIEWSLVA